MLPFLPVVKPCSSPWGWLALACPTAQSSALLFPWGRVLSAILWLSLCSETEGLAAGQPRLVFLSRLQVAVCACRQRWCSLPSLLGLAACGQAAGRCSGQLPACGTACLGQLSLEIGELVWCWALGEQGRVSPKGRRVGPPWPPTAGQREEGNGMGAGKQAKGRGPWP